MRVASSPSSSVCIRRPLTFVPPPPLTACPAAAPAARGGRGPAASRRTRRRWSAREPCTRGCPPSCATTPSRCPPPSPARRPPRSSPRTLSSRTRRCPPTRRPTPSPSWRRLGGDWRRRGGGTHYSRPSRGGRRDVCIRLAPGGSFHPSVLTRGSCSPFRHKSGKRQVCENMTVAYYFCGEPIPYRTSVKGRVVTLGQFKELLTKKGHYR